MNRLIVPMLVAAVLAGGAAAQVHQRSQHTQQEARAQAQQDTRAGLGPGLYRSVEASGQLKRGEQLPPRYRTHHFVVENWKARRLTEPPPGHQWVQAGKDYALVAIATGVIAEVLVAK